MSAWREIVVDRGDVGVRIDRVLQRHLSQVPGVSRNRLQRLIEAGAVSINGRAVSRASVRILRSDSVRIELPARKPRTAPAAERLPLDVRYEDEDLLIANKPPGQVSHPAHGHASGTLLNAVLGHLGADAIPSLVSRLDKDTSGLVLIAKRRAVHTAMQRLVAANGVAKDYLAIVLGKPPARGTIDLALDRDPWDKRRVTVRDRGGVPSVTRFERLLSIRLSLEQIAALGISARSANSSNCRNSSNSLNSLHLSVLRCRLVTGRMHQIRVHLAARGWPIAGDATYGVRMAGIDRQALHASHLAFAHPITDARIDVSAPLPQDMQRLLDLLRASEIGEHSAER